MQTLTTIDSVRATVRQWRDHKHSIAFVPTMGNLHAGHMQLVATAKQKADKVMVSIFVNPTQFGPNEDFDRYPRTERDDLDKLIESSTDALFLPLVAEIYPQPTATQISVTELSNRWCGASRPGHFDGVSLVVCKLLNCVQPDLLLLGEKDYQQLAVIRRMVADLNIPVAIQGVPTVRQADGLALSSRNGYLSAQEKILAPQLYAALCAMRQAIDDGADDYAQLLAQQRQGLENSGFRLDYLAICRADDLTPAQPADKHLVILVAAYLGKTRLIDNIQFAKQATDQASILLEK
jgi:pantoate--beta-alanine ligase